MPEADGSTVAVGVDFKDSELATRISTGVERIAELIDTELGDADEALRRLARPDGRSIRPLIAVACALTGTDPQAWDVTVAGGVVEMVHLAAVQHHEVTDSPRAAGNAERWHNDVAILAGDYLLATASRLLARLGADAVRVMAEAFARVVTGQMRAGRRAAGRAELAGDCLRVVREMTGSLTATAGYFGALFGGAASRDIARTKRLGRTIGVAVQIVDDLAVIAGDGTNSGVCSRRYSLPVLYALQGRGSGADRLRGLMSQPQSTDSEQAEALALVRASAGMDKAARAAARYARDAADDLTALPDSAGKRALGALVDHVRDSPSK